MDEEEILRHLKHIYDLLNGGVEEKEEAQDEIMMMINTIENDD